MTLRSKQLRKNIGLAFVLKAIGVGISFLQLPLTISYLTEVEYGIWVTVFLHAFVDVCALITGGLYTGALAETISGYQPIQLIGVVPYIILLCVLLRKKKMDQMLKRFNPEPENL